MKQDINENLIGAADDFLKLYKEVDKMLSGKLTNSFEEQTVKQLKDEVTKAAGNIPFHILARYEARIATLNMTLGEQASERVKQANMAYRFVKWKKSSEWNNTKARMKKDTEKVLVGDIENELVKITFADSMVEAYLQGLADRLLTLHGDTRSFLNSVAHRIRIETDSYSQSNKVAQ